VRADERGEFPDHRRFPGVGWAIRLEFAEQTFTTHAGRRARDHTGPPGG
jgi:hypothetical protein